MDAKRYWVPVSAGLLERKHVDAIGPAIWVYLWLLNRMPNNSGKVLYGRPIRASDIRKDGLGSLSDSTINRHLVRLEKSGYIRCADSGDSGRCITVNKAKGKRKNASGPRKNASPSKRASKKLSATDLKRDVDNMSAEGRRGDASVSATPRKRESVAALRLRELRSKAWEVVGKWSTTPALALNAKAAMSAVHVLKTQHPDLPNDSLVAALQELEACWQRGLVPNPYAYLEGRIGGVHMRISEQAAQREADAIRAFAEKVARGGA